MNQEIYVLSESRAADFSVRFLNEFLPDRIPASDDYYVPELSDTPSRVFYSDVDILEFLETNAAEPYGLYWNSAFEDQQVHQAMLFYTRDNHLILGLAVTPQSASDYFRRMMDFAQAKVGYFGAEQRPPETSAEFKALATGAARDG